MLQLSPSQEGTGACNPRAAFARLGWDRKEGEMPKSTDSWLNLQHSTVDAPNLKGASHRVWSGQ